MIDSLNSEQEALLRIIIDKWDKILLSIDPANRELAEEGIDLAYKKAKLPIPEKIWADSLEAGIELIDNSCGNSVRNSVSNSVSNSVWDSVRNSVRNSVRDSAWDSVWDSVWNSVWNSVRNSVWDSVWDSVRHSIFWSPFDYWLPFFDFFREIGIKETERMNGLFQFAENAGMALIFENKAILIERPNRILIRDNKCIHLEWPDGFAISELSPLERLII